MKCSGTPDLVRINRIRLEFKVIQTMEGLLPCRRINRIRLEFKVVLHLFLLRKCSVLIESDWNLKVAVLPIVICFQSRINRIRLEFKDNDGAQKSLEQQGINRIRLEFKGCNDIT